VLLHLGAEVEEADKYRFLCGRGRRRLDNCAVVADQVRQAVKELQRLVLKAKASRDFSGAQALEVMAGLPTSFPSLSHLPTLYIEIDLFVSIGELKGQVGKLEASLEEFSFLNSERDGQEIFLPSGDVPMDFHVSGFGRKSNEAVFVSINEKVARDGTRFVTSNFLFLLNSVKSGGHSIGSLAIVSGAGAILRFIRKNWPDFTALNGL
jgi:hypothetical protein